MRSGAAGGGEGRADDGGNSYTNTADRCAYSHTWGNPNSDGVSADLDAHYGPGQSDAYQDYPSGLSTSHAHYGPGQSDAYRDRPSRPATADAHYGPGRSDAGPGR